MAQRAIMNQFQNQTRPNAASAVSNPPKDTNAADSPTVSAPPAKPVEKNDGKNNLMSRESLKTLIKKYGNEKCDPEVEEFLQDIVSDFLTDTITASCKLAMHRKGDLLELKDVQMYLGK
jgi:transcription initiation factor TFIID subunit 12